MEDLHGNSAKIDAHSLNEYVKEVGNSNSNVILESMFCTRLPKETYCGIINLLNIFASNTSIDETEEALVSHIEFSNFVTIVD